MSLERKPTNSGDVVSNEPKANQIRVTDGKSGPQWVDATNYAQVVGRYGQHTLDQCHTIATALGYACVNISEKIDKARLDSPLENYLHRCHNDAEEELRLVNERITALTVKTTTSYSGQTTVSAQGIPQTHYQNSQP